VRRNILNALVVVGAVWLGVFSLYQGRFWFGVCFIALGVLRALLQFRRLKPSKREPEIRLEIGGDMDVLETLKAGVLILNDLMAGHRFSHSLTGAGKGSGGTFASAEFHRGNRRLELHLRYSLGLVAYVGSVTLSHEDFMWSVLGKRRASHYPGFSDDPLDGFRDLCRDLGEYGSPFLSEGDSEFLKCAERVKLLKQDEPRLPL